MYKIVNGKKVRMTVEEVAEFNVSLPTLPTFNDKVNTKIEELATKSSEIEEGGITVGELEVSTDRSTQALLNGAFVHAGRNPNQTFTFKGKNVWATVDKATIDAVNDVVGNHVRVTFDNEKAHHDAIQTIVDNIDTTEEEKLILLEDYDITTGW